MEVKYEFGYKLDEIGNCLKEWTGYDYNEGFLSLNTQYIIAKIEAEIIGVVQLSIIADPFWNRRWGLVENVFVKEKYRGNGISKGMMELVESQARYVGCEFVKLTSGFEKNIAHSLYNALGYKEGYSFKKILK